MPQWFQFCFFVFFWNKNDSTVKMWFKPTFPMWASPHTVWESLTFSPIQNFNPFCSSPLHHSFKLSEAKRHQIIIPEQAVKSSCGSSTEGIWRKLWKPRLGGQQSPRPHYFIALLTMSNALCFHALDLAFFFLVKVDHNDRPSWIVSHQLPKDQNTC